MALNHGNPHQASILVTLKTLRDAVQGKLTVQAKQFVIWADPFPLLPKSPRDAAVRDSDFSLVKNIERNYQ